MGLPPEANWTSDWLTLSDLDVTAKRKMGLVFFQPGWSDWENTCGGCWDLSVAPFLMQPRLNPFFNYPAEQQRTQK